jgi:hypothetical protein
MFLNPQCGIAKCLQNIFSFQIWIVGKNFFNAMTGSYLMDNHTYRNPHVANAGFSIHNVASTRNSV